jgi:hypothetical protein
MSAVRVGALEGMKQFVKKTKNDLLPQWLGSTVFKVIAG